MHHMMNSGDGLDRLNARNREARRIDGLIAVDEWNDPVQVDMRRQHAEMITNKRLRDAVQRSSDAVERALTDQARARALLGLAEDNKYTTAENLVLAEVRSRIANKAVIAAELDHSAALASVTDAGLNVDAS